MIDTRPLSRLEALEVYRTGFTDVALWQPFVQYVCHAHQLLPGEPVRLGIPGTYPAFIVAERWVIKFFGRLFDGGLACETEQEAARLAAQDPAIPIAPVIGHGELGGQGWHWPYLIFPYYDAVSVGSVWGELTHADRLRIATEMGDLCRRLHTLPLNGSRLFKADACDYLSFLAAQRCGCAARHRAWGSLPPHLIAQMDDFLLPIEALLPPSGRTHLIHADLTADHLLGRVKDGQWQTLALIDFGDARSGSLWYELAALLYDMLQGERDLYPAFFNAYGLQDQEREDFPRKALAGVLLHQFDVVSELPKTLIRESLTLEELATRLYTFI